MIGNAMPYVTKQPWMSASRIHGAELGLASALKPPAIASAQAVYCLSFDSGAVPDDAVDAGRLPPFVRSHSSNGQALGRPRAGQQMLQGFHLVPPAFLHCLCDPTLQPSHGATDQRPIGLVPHRRVVSGRTSRSCPLLSHPRMISSLSRNGTPVGRGHAFSGTVAGPEFRAESSSDSIRPVTGRHSLLPTSYDRRSMGLPCGWLAMLCVMADRRPFHVPRDRLNGRRRWDMDAGGHTIPCRHVRDRTPGHACQHWVAVPRPDSFRRSSPVTS